VIPSSDRAHKPALQKAALNCGSGSPAVPSAWQMSYAGGILPAPQLEGMAQEVENRIVKIMKEAESASLE